MSDIEEITAEAEQPKIAVAVGDSQSSSYALKWALNNEVSQGGSVYLLHVGAPLRYIPTPMGSSLPVEKVSDDVVNSFKEQRRKETETLLNQYRKMCEKRQVKPEVCYSENDMVQKELVDQISNLHIGKLILGTSSHSRIAKALKGPGMSSFVAKHSPDFCTVMVIFKAKLYSVKDAPKPFSSHSLAHRMSISTTSESSTSNCDLHEEDWASRTPIMQNGDRSCISTISSPDLANQNPKNTTRTTLFQNASMDLSRSPARWLSSLDSIHSPHAVRSFSSPPGGILRSASATPLIQPQYPQSITEHPSICSVHSNENFEGRASPVTGQYIEENFIDSSGQVNEHWEKTGIPATLPANNDTDSIISNANNDLLEIGLEREAPGSPNIDEEPSLQISSLESILAVANSEDITAENEELRRQLERAQREIEVQADRCIYAEKLVANAMKMVREHDAQRKEEIHVRDDALRDAQIAKQQGLKEAKRCEEALSALEEAKEMVRIALKDQETFRQEAAEEKKKHQEALAALEDSRRMVEAAIRDTGEAREQAAAETRRCEEALANLEELKETLELEVRLRKEAEEKALQETIAKQEALAALRKTQQRYMEYTFQELQAATDNFQEERKLGEGGYGTVYRGKIHHTTVAIKVLKGDARRGLKEFQQEVEVLSRIHHPHMVMLLGACPEKGCIVYEYMANGSLEDRLNLKDGTPPLPWYIRFRICSEVATALLFLHSRPEPIVHRDLKPGNILLDHNFVSKIGDVGLAQLVPNNLTFSITMYKETELVGTFAYIDPDYQRTGVVSRESDVYALGIVMLQLLTGKPPVGVTDLVEQAVDNGRLYEVLDSSAGEWPLEAAMELACLSLQCAEPRRRHRPDLETIVISVLENIRVLADEAAAREAASISSSFLRTDPITPSFFLCPISQEIMEDPSIAADGFTYENDVINAWLQEHDTSPMTNLRLNHKNLIPNHSIRSAIKEWHENFRSQVSI